MVPFGGRPTRSCVTVRAVHTANNNMRSVLAASGAAVMATAAIGGRCKATVVDFCACPSAGGLVAAFAVTGDTIVNGSSGTAGLTVSAGQVAGRALAGYGDIRVKARGSKRSKTALMANIAIGRSAVANALIRNVCA
jgi:hypothetical protein